MISIKPSIGRGRGVFADREFRPGEIIETAPMIVIPEIQRPLISATLLDSFVFEWGVTGAEVAIALGFGSLYNHSDNANAHYRRDLDRSELTFVSVARIAEGDEIFINYNGNESSSIPIVFDGDHWKTIVAG